MATDLLGGHIPLASDLLSNFAQLATDKKVRLLAVASARRMSILPDVPTVQELIHTRSRQPRGSRSWPRPGRRPPSCRR
jgi:tripartite-type tricarboxylate transporter receptor subunit TctC